MASLNISEGPKQVQTPQDEVLNIAPNSFVTPPNYKTLNCPIPEEDIFGGDKSHFYYFIDPSMSLLSFEDWEPKTYVKRVNGLDIEIVDYFRVKNSTYGTVYIKYYSAYNRCHIEFSPSVLAFGKSTELLRPRHIDKVVESIIDGLSDELWPAFDRVDPDTGEVCRSPSWRKQVAVVTTEFAVHLRIRNDLLNDLKKAIDEMPQRRGAIKTRWSDGRGGWSAYVETKGKKSGYDVLYDKTAELAARGIRDNPEPGHTSVRFETKLAGKRRDRFEIRTLEEFTDEKAWNVIAVRFHQLQFNVTLSGPNQVKHALQNLSYNQRERLLGYLKLDSIGLADDMSVAIKRDRRKIAKKVGIAPGHNWELQSTEAVYLDISRGRFVPTIEQATVDESAA
jgi:hypothetical protein